MSEYSACWREPRCLVHDAADGSLSVNDATLEALRRVTDPLDVVCIVGRYRTGKSYLMNWLAGATLRSSTDAKKHAGSYMGCLSSVK